MTETTKTKRAYDAFVVDESGKSAQWTKVGAAWTHEDGKGLNVSLAGGFSVSGKIVLRAPDAERKQKTSAKEIRRPHRTD